MLVILSVLHYRVSHVVPLVPVDFKSKVVFCYEEHTACPIRSCIEVFLMLGAFSRSAEGRFSIYLLPEPVLAMCATAEKPQCTLGWGAL